MEMEQLARDFHRLAWLNPKTERRATPPYGDGVFAKDRISKGEVLTVWGGVIVSTAELKTLPIPVQDRAIQVEDDQHLCSGQIDDDADCFNHSCNPNAGLQGQITLIATRDIEPDEEVCFDYAMSDGHPSYYLHCECGQPQCRHEVTGNDWQRPDLQERYKGYFSPYIQRRIDALR